MRELWLLENFFAPEAYHLGDRLLFAPIEGENVINEKLFKFI